MRPLQFSSGDLVVDRRAGFAAALARDKDFAAAAEVMAGAVEERPGWTAGWSLLGDYHAEAGNSAGAIAAYEQLARLDADGVFGAGLILTALSGYVGLARFIATQLIITSAIIVTTYIGLLLGKAISRQDNFGDTLLGRFLETRFKLGPVAIDQVGLVVGLLIYAVALLTGIPLILLLWGFHVQDLQLLAYRLFTEVRLGGISI